MDENETQLEPTAIIDEDGLTRSWGSNGMHDAESNAVSTAEPAADATSVAADVDGSAFLADLAKAMQSTAEAERLKVADETERRHAAHVESIRDREASESAALRDVAETDSKGIDAWADAEIERIQGERERRILARRRDLEISIDDHKALVAREVGAVDDAIVAYRSEIEAYFSRLETETDPVLIAQLAGSRPRFPALDTIGPDDAPAQAVAAEADAHAEAALEVGTPPTAEETDAPSVDETTLIGVMDADTSVAEAGDEQPASAIAGETASGAATAIDQETESAAGTGAVTARSSAALLQAVPSLRPMASWFRRDGDHDTTPGEER